MFKKNVFIKNGKIDNRMKNSDSQLGYPGKLKPWVGVRDAAKKGTLCLIFFIFFTKNIGGAKELVIF